jgi:glycosyltransferase involved in cell wall biosynthesis
LKIVHTIAYLAPSDGHVAYCMRLAQELQATGHACEIVAGEWCAGFEAPLSLRDCIHVLPPHGIRARGHVFDPTYARRMQKIFCRLAPDVVHLHGFWSPLVVSAIAAARRCNRPVILSPHGALGDWARQRQRVPKRLFAILRRRHYHRDVACYHATSELEAGELRRDGFSNTVVIPIGVDLPDIPERPAARAGHTMLYLSRLHPKKGLANWVKAWALVRPEGWRMRVVGGCEGAYAVSLQILVRELGLERVFSFEEAIYGDARTEAYRTADVVVLPSLTENFGMVVTEALAQGVPVITTTATPWRELPRRNCGWCVAPTVEALAEALRASVALSDDARREMGRRGRAWMAQDFLWRRCAEAMTGAYESTIKRDAG